MTDLRVRYEPSLRSLSASRIAAITSAELAFASCEWLQMVERLDLATIVGGEVDLQYAIVEEQGTPVAICPLTSARGAEVVATYNFRRYYFKYFFREDVQERTPQLERTARFVSAYERVLDWLRCSLDGLFSVSNPLSYRTQVAIAGDAGCSVEQVHRTLVSALQRRAHDLGRPVCYFAVAEDDDILSRCLADAGFLRVFATYDNRVDLSKCRSFDDYLQTFRPKSRWTLRKERKKLAASSVTIEPISDIAARADAMTRFYAATYAKHSPSYLNHPPDFWVRLSQHLGQRMEVLWAADKGQPVGFSILLKCDKQQEQWLYRIGRDYAYSDTTPLYFELAFYQPIERAIQSGYKQYWLGPGGYDAKRRRGAEQVPFYSWFWFPKKRDRWFLSDYLKRFGEAIRQGIERQACQPLRLAGTAARNGSPSAAESP
jgi:predicted N-acyltransferase